MKLLDDAVEQLFLPRDLVQLNLVLDLVIDQRTGLALGFLAQDRQLLLALFDRVEVVPHEPDVGPQQRVRVDLHLLQIDRPGELFLVRFQEVLHQRDFVLDVLDLRVAVAVDAGQPLLLAHQFEQLRVLRLGLRDPLGLRRLELLALRGVALQPGEQPESLQAFAVDQRQLVELLLRRGVLHAIQDRFDVGQTRLQVGFLDLQVQQLLFEPPVFLLVHVAAALAVEQHGGFGAGGHVFLLGLTQSRFDIGAGLFDQLVGRRHHRFDLTDDEFLVLDQNAVEDFLGVGRVGVGQRHAKAAGRLGIAAAAAGQFEVFDDVIGRVETVLRIGVRLDRFEIHQPVLLHRLVDDPAAAEQVDVVGQDVFLDDLVVVAVAAQSRRLAGDHDFRVRLIPFGGFQCVQDAGGQPERGG